MWDEGIKEICPMASATIYLESLLLSLNDCKQFLDCPTLTDTVSAGGKRSYAPRILDGPRWHLVVADPILRNIALGRPLSGHSSLD